MFCVASVICLVICHIKRVWSCVVWVGVLIIPTTGGTNDLIASTTAFHSSQLACRFRHQAIAVTQVRHFWFLCNIRHAGDILASDPLIGLAHLSDCASSTSSVRVCFEPSVCAARKGWKEFPCKQCWSGAKRSGHRRKKWWEKCPRAQLSIPL